MYTGDSHDIAKLASIILMPDHDQVALSKRQLVLDKVVIKKKQEMILFVSKTCFC